MEGIPSTHIIVASRECDAVRLRNGAQAETVKYPHTEAQFEIATSSDGALYALDTKSGSISIRRDETNVWTELFSISDAVKLAVSSQGIWTLAKDGTVTYRDVKKKSKKSKRRRKSVACTVTPPSVVGNVTCIEIDERDCVWLGTQNGIVWYSWSHLAESWNSLPKIGNEGWLSPITRLFSKSSESILCVAACVGAVFCCLGETKEIWRYSYNGNQMGSIGAGLWGKIEVPLLDVTAMSAMSRGDERVLLTVPSDGVLRVWSEGMNGWSRTGVTNLLGVDAVEVNDCNNEKELTSPAKVARTDERIPSPPTLISETSFYQTAPEEFFPCTMQMSEQSSSSRYMYA